MNWWLSFAGEEGFRGVVVVWATGFFDAVTRTHALEINPGGEVKGFPIPDDFPVPSGCLDRLMSKEEASTLNKSWGRCDA